MVTGFLGASEIYTVTSGGYTSKVVTISTSMVCFLDTE